jgi:cell division protein FtsQ
MPRHTAIQDRGILPPYEPTRNKGGNRRKILHWVLLLAFLGLLFLGIQNANSALWGSDLFKLTNVSVVGNRLLSADEVVGRAGLEIGGSLFNADLSAATERVKSHSVVRETLLLRQPPETLVISVEEREPVATVSRRDGLSGLDREGTLFTLPLAPLDLPVITGIEVLDCDSLMLVEKVLPDLAAFFGELEREAPAFLDGVSEVCVESTQEVRVYLVGDVLQLRMRLSDPSDQARNFQAYLTSRTCLQGAPAYVDLRFEHQVVIGRL